MKITDEEKNKKIHEVVEKLAHIVFGSDEDTCMTSLCCMLINTGMLCGYDKDTFMRKIGISWDYYQTNKCLDVEY
jgi:hypothetical protein